MGSTFHEEKAEMGLGNQRVLAQIDKLREINVGSIVPLPQLVVVGDQSSGKSSVLESLTGFSFPRGAGLCTRYATQITCARENHKSVTVSIIPRPDADSATQESLRKFHRRVTDLTAADFGSIFDEANQAMGIQPINANGDSNAPRLITFSEDILKIEISGPDQDHLTVIDVPGIFRTASPGLTTESDIKLVSNMVRRYMKDSRTIILAVIPCNVDIATQEILKLAKDADPQGVRTMGVLTKPDLTTERATQQAVLDLIQGKRNDLTLGYCLVKNRGADDQESSLALRHELEKDFFRCEPWSDISSSGRVGIDSLKKRLSELLMDISRREYPKVRVDIQKKLGNLHQKQGAMGMSRSSEMEQRQYLGEMARHFEEIVGHALNVHYGDNEIFKDSPETRLITRIVTMNEVFADTFERRGHTHYFDQSTRPSDEDVVGERWTKQSRLRKVPFDYPYEDYVELESITVIDPFGGIVDDDTYECPEPYKNTIMDHIGDVYDNSRGSELGTFSGALLGTIFREQSKKWEPLVLSHTSNTIVIVHQFICSVLERVFQDRDVLNELWESILLEKLQEAYKRAMARARFLLRVELEGKPLTYNHYFNSTLQKIRTSRTQATLAKLELPGPLPAKSMLDSIPDDPRSTASSGQQQTSKGAGSGMVSLRSLDAFTENKGNRQQVLEDLHDILQSYYKVAMKRFVDVVCQLVIDDCLISGPESPLKVFGSSLVLQLDASKLEMIAGEAMTTKQERKMLAREIENLEAAVKILRG